MQLRKLLSCSLLAAASSPRRRPPTRRSSPCSGKVEIGHGTPPVWPWRRAATRSRRATPCAPRAGARAELALGDNRIVRVYEQSVLRVGTSVTPTGAVRSVELDEGQSIFDVMKKTVADEFEVITPEIVVSVKGTRFLVAAVEGADYTAVFRGEVGLAGDGFEAALRAPGHDRHARRAVPHAVRGSVDVVGERRRRRPSPRSTRAASARWAPRSRRPSPARAPARRATRATASRRRPALLDGLVGGLLGSDSAAASANDDGGVVGGATDLLGSLLGPVLDPVTDPNGGSSLVGGTTDLLGDLLGPVTDPIVDPVLGGTTDLLGDLLAPVVDPGAIAGPTGGGSLLTPVVEPVGGLLGGLLGGGRSN